MSRTVIAMVRCLESHHTEGACLFDGTPKGDGRKKRKLQKTDFKIVVFLCLIMSIGPITNETRCPSKRGLRSRSPADYCQQNCSASQVPRRVQMAAG